MNTLCLLWLASCVGVLAVKKPRDETYEQVCSATNPECRLPLEFRDPADRAAAAASVAAHPMSFFAAGTLGLLVQLAGLLAVKCAGSVAVKLLGIARGAALVLFEAAFASEGARPAPGQLGGYGVSVAAFGVYTWVRLKRPTAPKPSGKTE